MEQNKQWCKVDNEKIINIQCIRWVKKMDECLQICTKSDGCEGKLDTHQVCKINNAESYRRLNRLFE